MIFLEQSSILSEIIEEYTQLIPVINRFGIKLGIEDKTIGDICKELNINRTFLLVILNTYINEDYFPERQLQKIDIELVTNYLRKTDMYLIHGPLHNLEKHLNAFIAMSDPNNTQLGMLGKLFAKFKQELTNQVQQGTIENNISIGLITDLKNILIKHISGNFNENMCYAVIFSLDSLEKDLERHNRIREKILKPLVDNLAELGIDDWQSLLVKDKAIAEDKGNLISPRELDVLKLVASGCLNKEIADKLNISLNTVLSHRKNITAKLGIKTVSGLIFYCITHGYISADEIEL